MTALAREAGTDHSVGRPIASVKTAKLPAAAMSIAINATPTSLCFCRVPCDSVMIVLMVSSLQRVLLLRTLHKMWPRSGRYNSVAVGSKLPYTVPVGAQARLRGPAGDANAGAS